VVGRPQLPWWPVWLEQLLQHASKVLFLAPSVTFVFFVCESNTLEMAEWICAKFTGKTGHVWSLARTSVNVKVKGQRSRSPGTKNTMHSHHPPAATEWNTLAANNVTHQQKGPFRRCRGVISAACYGLCLVKYLYLYVCILRARVQPTLDPYTEAFL